MSSIFNCLRFSDMNLYKYAVINFSKTALGLVKEVFVAAMSKPDNIQYQHNKLQIYGLSS